MKMNFKTYKYQQPNSLTTFLLWHKCTVLRRTTGWDRASETGKLGSIPGRIKL